MANSKTQRWILHADMDAFYASVEQRDRPELKGKPVIIGASSSRGVVSAASYEARAFGVHSAMPGFQARKLCPQGIFLPGDMKKYARVSAQVHGVFAEFTDQIEPLAFDEAFLDITGSLALLGSPETIAKNLRRRVLEETGLIVSVGLASSKLVAKTACGLGKPNGLFLVAPGAEEELLAPLAIRKLFGIGPKAEEKLILAGIETIGQLALASDALVTELFGRHGDAMRQRARGIDPREVEGDGRRKSIGEESTFAGDVTDQAQIASALVAHSEAVAARARRAGLIAGTVVIKVKLAKRKNQPTGSEGARMSNHDLFPLMSRQARLNVPGADGAEIARLAQILWKRLNLNDAIRLLGVTLTDLVAETQSRQLSLFERASPRERASAPKPGAAAPTGALAAPELSRGERLGRTLDAIGDKFGAGTIRRAAAAPDKVTASDRIKLGESD